VFRAPLAGGGADSVQEGGGADSGWPSARAHVAGNDPWGLIDIEEWRQLRTRAEWADARNRPLPEPELRRLRLATRSGVSSGSEEFVHSLRRGPADAWNYAVAAAHAGGKWRFRPLWLSGPFRTLLCQARARHGGLPEPARRRPEFDR